MDRTRLQNTRAWIAFVPHACTAFPSSSCRLTMIFSESKINLFTALSIIVIRLGTQYYKCLSPESKYVHPKSIIARSSHLTINGPAGPQRINILKA